MAVSPVLELQRRAGNRATMRALSEPGALAGISDPGWPSSVTLASRWRPSPCMLGRRAGDAGGYSRWASDQLGPVRLGREGASGSAAQR
jgi:hypothetical protein